MEFLNTFFRYTAREMAVFADIMYHFGNTLQRGDNTAMQRMGEHQGDNGRQQNAAGQYDQRSTEKMTD